MAFYKDHVYPQLVSMLGNPKPIEEIRQRIVPLAQGTVLEIGVGPGVNFAHYDPAKVDKVYALEPNPGMLRRAEEQRRRTQLHIEFFDLPGECISLADASVDTVVSTFTLCTIPAVVEAIQGIGRVLKPHGKLIFFEHGFVARSFGATLAAAIRTVLSFGIRRLPRDTRYSVTHRQGRLQYRTAGRRVPRSISKVGVVLLVGCGGSRTAKVRPQEKSPNPLCSIRICAPGGELCDF